MRDREATEKVPAPSRNDEMVSLVRSEVVHAGSTRWQESFKLGNHDPGAER